MNQVLMRGLIETGKTINDPDILVPLLIGLEEESSQDNDSTLKDHCSPQDLSSLRISIDLVYIEETGRVLSDRPPLFTQLHKHCFLRYG